MHDTSCSKPQPIASHLNCLFEDVCMCTLHLQARHVHPDSMCQQLTVPLLLWRLHKAPPDPMRDTLESCGHTLKVKVPSSRPDAEAEQVSEQFL